MPLFPLQAVVVPGSQVPLHIFEERYKELVGEAIRDGTEFGIVLAREGQIAGTGCAVTVEKVIERYPDGRMDILTRAWRRFEIVSIDEERAFLRGNVEFFDDDEPGPAAPELREKAIEQYRNLVAVLETPPATEIVPDHPQLSFLLAQPVLDLDFLQVLLTSRSEQARLRRLAAFLAEYVPKQRLIARVRHIAPLNGHSTPPGGI